MEKLTVKAPEGYEFSGINDNGEIEFSLKKEKYPVSVNEIKERNWYITGNGIIHELESYFPDPDDLDINNVSTEGRAKAILALTQLLELRDAWNKVDGFVVDWSNFDQDKWCITPVRNEITFNIYGNMSRVLYFGSLETAKLFYEMFKLLTETAKELL